MKKWIILWAAAAAMVFAGCSGNRSGQVDADFSQYVNAYSAGILHDGASIKVELTMDVDGAEPGQKVGKGVLDITPKLKGTAIWTSKKSLEYVPDEGALKNGRQYRVKVNLGRLYEIADKSLRQMEFTVAVARKQAVTRITDMVISGDNPDVIDVVGEIEMNCPMSPEDVKKGLSYSFTRSCGDAKLSVEGERGTIFTFRIDNVARDEYDNWLNLKFSAKGFEDADQTSVKIPAKGVFEVVSCNAFLDGSPRFELLFSDLLAKNITTAGMVTVDGGRSVKVGVSGNKATVWFDKEQEGTLVLNVSRYVKNSSGKTLEADYSESFTTMVPVPAVEFPFSGNILPDPSNLVLPFRAVNLRAVDVRVIKIYSDNILTFLQDNELGGSSELRRSGRLVYSGQIRLDADPSKDLTRWQTFSVDLSGLFKQEAGAIYRIRFLFRKDYYIGSDEVKELGKEASDPDDFANDSYWDIPNSYAWEDSGIYDWWNYEWSEKNDPTKASFYMDGNKFPARNLMTSKLGIIAKRADGFDMDIFVNDILSTKPVSGAKVKVYDYQLQEIGSGCTDGDGHAKVNASRKPFVITATSSNSTTYLKVNDGEENLLSRFDVGGVKIENGLKGYPYGERGVWRPGDTLHLTLFVEDPAKDFPASHPAILDVYSSDGQFYSRKIEPRNLNGFYTFDVPTSEGDPTGTWNAYFKVGGATFHKSLMVETVKPNRLKVKLKLPEVINSKFDYELASNWLTGPAASGLKYELEMNLKDGSSRLARKGYAGYVFRNPLSSFTSSTYLITGGRLDAAGKDKANVDISVPQAPGILSASVVSRVFEEGGDESFSLTETCYSPYYAYVGVRQPSEEYLETDTDHSFKVVAVTANGTSLSGRKLEYTIYKLDWSWWWDDDADKLGSYVSGSSAKVHSSGTVTTSSDGASVPFRIDYPEWGRYLLIVKDLTGGHMSGFTFMSDWPAWRGRSNKNDPTSLTMVTFSTDKKTYEVGENAVLYIPAAAEGGRALVSFENATGVIHSEWVKTSKGEDTPYKFKITREMAPNFHIHLTLLQPHGRTGNDLPVRMYGVQPVEVSSKASHLNPVITMPDVVRPLETFNVKVKEAAGKPMTYTLAIVDDGLLDITGYRTPDLWTAMNRKQALGVRTWDVYDNVTGAYSGRFSPMYSIGGDEDMVKGSRKESRFNPVVKVLGPFELKRGEQTHKITLPMYVGSVRVMVVAGQNHAYGNAEKTVPVRTPVMVLPALPRKVSVGETVSLPVNVFLMESGISRVDVSVTVEGAAGVVGESTKTVSFDGPGDEVVTFALKASAEVGRARVTVTAKGGEFTARETVNIDATNPNPVTVKTISKVIEPGQSAVLNYPSASEGGISAIMEAMSYPSIDINGCFTYMVDYKHLCGEQICARGIALCALRDLLDADRREEADALIAELLTSLYPRQLPGGGFALWQGQNVADPWVTSMAGHFMGLAARNGYGVDASVMSKWADYQRSEARAYRKMESEMSEGFDVCQAYRLYSLALNGKAQEASMNRMRENDSLNETAKWLLASAYSLSGKKQTALNIIGNIDITHLPSGNGVWTPTYGSALRDKAIAVEALCLADRMTEAVNMSRDLSEEFRREYYYTTQTTAFAAAAVSRLAAKIGGNTVSIELGDRRKTDLKKIDRSFVTASLDVAEKSVEIRNTGDNDVYVNVIGKVRATAGTNVEASASGIDMKVSYVDRNGAAVDVKNLPQGSDFYINVMVGGLKSLQAGKNMALVVPVASGWEIFNERLYGASGAGLAGAQYVDYRDDAVNVYFSLAQGSQMSFKVRVRAAYKGSFTLPSVSCEDMYHPEIHANTASGNVVVR